MKYLYGDKLKELSIWILQLAKIACSLFIPCIIWGSIIAASYAKNQKIRNSYRSTTCFLLNYTFFEHECETCETYSTSYHSCFDEKFSISYLISNQILITTVLDSFDRNKKHLQTQVQSVIFVC
jgi:hypothetical protein